MKLKIGDWVEYHTSKWQQEEAGLAPVEMVEVVSIDPDGGIGYNNKRGSGHIGSARIEEVVKPLSDGSTITYWEWRHTDFSSEFSITLKKCQSTITSIMGSIAMIELFNGVKKQVDLCDLLFDNAKIDYEYFKLNAGKQLEKLA